MRVYTLVYIHWRLVLCRSERAVAAGVSPAILGVVCLLSF